MEWTPFITSSFSRWTSGTPSRSDSNSAAKAAAMSSSVAEGRLGDVGPLPEGPAGLVQHVEGIGQQPVVGEGQTGRASFGEALQGDERRGEVEVGGWRGWPEDARVGQLHPDCVPGEQDAAQAVVQGHVVLGVSGRVDGDERSVGAHTNRLAILKYVDPLGRRGIEPTVERVEQRPVDPGGRIDQAGRIGEVSGSFGMDVHRCLGESASHVTHPAGMVEVYVGDHYAGQIVKHRHRAAPAGPTAPARNSGCPSPPVPGHHPR